MPGFGFPCGCVESGERPGQAAVRECFEETGYHVVLNDAAPYVEMIDNIVVSTYWASVVGEREKPTHADEGNAEWIRPWKFLEQTVYPDYNIRCLQYFSPIVIDEIQLYFCPQCKTGLVDICDMAEMCVDCSWLPDWSNKKFDKIENYVECSRCNGKCCMWQRIIPGNQFITDPVYHISPEYHRCVCDPNQSPNC